MQLWLIKIHATLVQTDSLVELERQIQGQVRSFLDMINQQCGVYGAGNVARRTCPRRVSVFGIRLPSFWL